LAVVPHGWLADGVVAGCATAVVRARAGAAWAAKQAAPRSAATATFIFLVTISFSPHSKTPLDAGISSRPEGVRGNMT
jgi:hypothetical protein